MSKASDTPRRLRVAVLTYSNRRTAADDGSGDLIRARLTTAGHHIAASAIRHGDAATLREFLRGTGSMGAAPALAVDKPERLH